MVIVNLSLKDLWDDRYVSLCVIAALVAVIAPLLLLFGLKNGIMTQLTQELLNNPDIKAVKLVGNHRLDQEWVERLAALPEVGFVVPMTRSLNTEIDLVKDARHFIENLEMLPSAAGDPLSPLLIPRGVDQMVISEAVAKKMQVDVGDQVRLVVSRNIQGRRERGKRELTVMAVIPDAVYPRPVSLVSLDLLVAVEDFKDGYVVTDFGLKTGIGLPPERFQFARVRLYAQDLDDVATLEEWLGAQHIDALTQRQEIESVKAIDRLLSIIFKVIAWTAVVGAIAALIGALLSNIDRKRKSLAMLRLMGLMGKDIVLFILSQTVTLAFIAFAVAMILFTLGQLTFNQALAHYLPQSAYACYLSTTDIVVACTTTLFLSAVISGIGGFRALNVQPAESLRDV